MKNKEEELKGAFTTCSSCGYEALTWHEDIEDLRDCRKCGGKLELMVRKVGGEE